VAAALRKEGIEPSDPGVVGMIAAVETIFHRGPIPPASTLAEYERLRPGTADQIIDWADRQFQHRLERERQQSERAETRLDRSQRYAFGLAVLGLVVAALVGTIGQNTIVACALAVVAVGGPGAATIIARWIKPPAA
jgi:uncharacterized membrane protein